MAKDPAMLWYWNDWNGGTLTFSRHLKGCYMDVLSAQFNAGPLSLEEIKTVLGSDFSAWGTIQKKFTQTSTGLFFNERLEAEKEKRKAFTESRRQNRRKKTYDASYDEHMIAHMENENTNVFKGIVEGIGGMGEKEEGKGWVSNPTYPENSFELSEMETGQAIEYVYFLKRKELKKEDINQYWIAFQIQHFTGKKYYNDKSDVLSHFRNWIKNQDLDGSDNKHSGNNAGAKPGTSEARIQALKNWGGTKIANRDNRA